jgi:hypothetical protein
LDDGLSQCLARVIGLDGDAMVISVNNHLGLRVYSDHGAGHRPIAMRAGHAFDGEKMVHGGVLLKKTNLSIALSLKKWHDPNQT